MKKYPIIILTGLSGSGKGTAIAALEDSGFYCIDNMPVELLPKFLELPIRSTSGMLGLALVMDLRDNALLTGYTRVFNLLQEKGYRFDLVFLEAEDTVLLRRFSQTRRPHPIAEHDRLIENIKVERILLEGLRRDADKIIDTSNYTLHKLKEVIVSLAKKAGGTGGLKIILLSFGYKYGIPTGADLLIDVRFLQNPYFVEELRELSGLEDNVKEYVLNNESARQFIEKYTSLLDFLIPLYQDEGKSYLTIAVGCTGGRHRSVAISENLFTHLKSAFGETVSVNHRDIEL